MDTLEDIQRRLKEDQYRNEEHVRLSLVARILQEYGWNIWDPTEVNAEFVPVPQEDNKRVDVALFVPPQTPAVFIEVKPIGGITNLAQTERQLRDYNRNMAATFCIITDGREWRFYYSLTPGEFRDKCFRTTNLLTDDLSDINRTFAVFLDKNQVQSTEARKQAENLLSLNRIERILADCLSDARRAVLRPPYPSLPDALKELAEKRGIQVSREDAAAFIEKSEKQPPPPDKDRESQRRKDGVTEYDPDNPPDLAFTKIISASIGRKDARNWNRLAEAGFQLAWQQGHADVAVIRNWSGANIRPGTYTREGFRPVRGTGLSVPGMAAPHAWTVALRIAKKLRVSITVDFVWSDKKDAAHPGKQARMQWAP